MSVQDGINEVGQPIGPTPKKEEAVPQKPMSIEAYTKALQKEYDVAKLRAGIAKFMFEERMAMTQLRQMEMGMMQAPQPSEQDSQSEEGSFTEKSNEEVPQVDSQY